MRKVRTFELINMLSLSFLDNAKKIFLQKTLCEKIQNFENCTESAQMAALLYNI